MKAKVALFSFSFFILVGNASVMAETTLPPSYTALVQFAIPSPDQKRSGSCLYMASTGAMEILWNKSLDHPNPEVDGETDLAELYASQGKMGNVVKTWYENPILKFRTGGVLSRKAPFDSRTFWKTGLPYGNRVDLPKVMTKSLFHQSGPKGFARKKFGELREADIEKVKKAMIEREGPVVVIYRSAGKGNPGRSWDTWHTVVIMGYDDEGVEEGGSGSCKEVTRTLSGLGWWDKKKLRRVMARGGGCREKGVFYVRDSEDALGENNRAPLFELRSYDWLKFLGNHGYVAYLENKGPS